MKLSEQKSILNLNKNQFLIVLFKLLQILNSIIYCNKKIIFKFTVHIHIVYDSYEIILMFREIDYIR
jgi:hypothetical protein